MNDKKDKRGLKRICPNCGTHFYDFWKRPINCPECNTEFTLDTKKNPTTTTTEEKQ